MSFIEEKDEEIIISKSEFFTLPNNQQVKEMIKLEEEQESLKKVIKDSEKTKSSNLEFLSIKDGINTMFGIVSSVWCGGLDIALAMAMLSNLPYRVNPIPFLVVNNIALGSALFIGINNKIRFDRKKQAVKVQFNQIEEVINNEIERKVEAQQQIAGDDTSLTSAFVKIKSL